MIILTSRCQDLCMAAKFRCHQAEILAWEPAGHAGLADGKKIPRWKPRSQRMVNMGHSPKHASTVPLVLNPATGSISAQFNMDFDDYFSTVAAGTDQQFDFNSPEWSNIFGSSTLQEFYFWT